MNDDIGVFHGGAQCRLVADIALDEIEVWVGAEVIKSLLAGSIHEVIEGRDAEVGVEEVFAEDAAEVAEPTGDENAFAHAAALREKEFVSRSVNRGSENGQVGCGHFHAGSGSLSPWAALATLVGAFNGERSFKGNFLPSAFQAAFSARSADAE